MICRRSSEIHNPVQPAVQRVPKRNKKAVGPDDIVVGNHLMSYQEAIAELFRPLQAEIGGHVHRLRVRKALVVLLGFEHALDLLLDLALNTTR